MTEHGKKLVQETFGASGEKIDVIPHGIPTCRSLIRILQGQLNSGSTNGMFGNAVRNDINLLTGRAKKFPAPILAVFRHRDKPRRQRNQFVHDALLVVVRLLQDRVQRRDEWHFQFAQQRQQITSCFAAENSKFVLKRKDVHVAQVQKIRCAPIR